MPAGAKKTDSNIKCPEKRHVFYAEGAKDSDLEAGHTDGVLEVRVKGAAGVAESGRKSIPTDYVLEDKGGNTGKIFKEITTDTEGPAGQRAEAACSRLLRHCGPFKGTVGGLTRRRMFYNYAGAPP